MARGVGTSHGSTTPALESVATEGEWLLVFIIGEFSHVANKRVSIPETGAIIGTLFAEETNTPWQATADQVRLAQDAIASVTDRWGTIPTYARVDAVIDDAGFYRVLELELPAGVRH
ncbi:MULTISPECIES: hypothetical protein [Auritidibacter]|uniref:hypothetical protein n=1 Tax=Auritidibacter TaxID=1160973 RepID=UPI000D73456C|nr:MULTISPECIES: hypothetical protein [Auritidibacter]PXA77163.1 hypothetical protein DCC24_04280 [Auritidibacter sp. NML100628]WHS27606.1 hypothetical protein QM395_09510 [Auritidibacter ignavus]